MKYVSEFRDPAAAKALIGEIAALAADQPARKFMEVCGGHTHAIYRHGIETRSCPSRSRWCTARAVRSV